MAEGAPIKLGEAFVEIVTSEHGLIAAFHHAEGEATSFSHRMAGIMTEFAAIAIPAGIVTTVIELGKKGIEAAAELSILSKEVGVTVEDMSRLQYAGKSAGLEVEDITMSLKFLSRQMNQGENDMGKPSKALDRLGISSVDAQGKLRPTVQVLLDVAEAFKRLPDGAEKTATAVELFGRQGIRMIPFLDKGREGLSELAKRSDALGYTMSTSAAEGAHEFEVSLKFLQARVAATSREIANTILPSITTLTRYFNDEYVPRTEEAAHATTGFGTSLNVLATEGDQSLTFWQQQAAGIIIWTTALKEARIGLKFVAAELSALGQDTTGLSTRERYAKIGRDMAAAYRDAMKEERAAALEGVDAVQALTEHERDNAEASREAANASALHAQKIADLNRSAEVRILTQKQAIAGLKDDTATEEMYAKALDIVTADEMIRAGTNKTLVDILMQLNEQQRVAAREAKARAEAEREAEKAERQREEAARRAFAAETRMQRARREEQQHAIEQQTSEESKLATFLIQSRKRVAEATETGQQKELDELNAYYQTTLQTFSECTDAAVDYTAAREQLEIEVDQRKRAIDARYATDEVTLLRRRLAAHANLAAQIATIEEHVLDAAGTAMEDGFFDLMSGRFHDLDDVMKNFFTSIKHEIARFLADQATKKLEEWLLQLATSYFSHGGTSVTAGAVGGGYGAPTQPIVYAGGGTFMSGVMQAGGGTTVSTPTMIKAGEGGQMEAVVPMPNGKLPVQLMGDRSDQAFQIQQAIRVVIGADLLASMKTSEDETIVHVRNNYARGGDIYNLLNSRGRR